jgi:TerC family integral membrane protein
MASTGLIEWAGFAIVVVAALATDLVSARRGGRTPSVRNAVMWSCLWIGLGLAFGVFVAVRLGADAGLSYITAYLLEKSLSVDNLFLFVLIFGQTGIPARLQHRALFWGVVGALVMRAVLIALGVYLLDRFHWVMYVFAALLVISPCACCSARTRRRAWSRRAVPCARAGWGACCRSGPSPRGRSFSCAKAGAGWRHRFSSPSW